MASRNRPKGQLHIETVRDQHHSAELTPSVSDRVADRKITVPILNKLTFQGTAFWSAMGILLQRENIEKGKGKKLMFEFITYISI